jgi:hypothetical protein
MSYAPWLSTSTPIFGGTKHWMTAYPFLCLFGAEGFQWVCARLSALLPRDGWRSWIAPAGLTASVVTGPVVMALHSHPWGLSAYTPIVGGAPGAASLGLNRSFWGYTTGAVTDFINAHAERGTRVYLHDTATESWKQLIRDGRIERGIQGTLGLSSTELALYHHEQHMARVEYQLWVDYGTVSPAHVGAYDGVPVVWVFARKQSAHAK